MTKPETSPGEIHLRPRVEEASSDWRICSPLGIDGSPTEEWAWFHCLFRADAEPFSASRAVSRLHFPRRSTSQHMAELAAAGWLIPVRRHTFIPADPTVRAQPEVERALAPFREACFYPTLHLAVGRILRAFGEGLTTVLLFGSAARRTESPHSDLDLLAVGPGLYGRKYNDRIDKQADIVEHAFCHMVGRLERVPGHRHSLHITTLPTKLFAEPGGINSKLMSGFADDGHVLYDPDFQLGAALMRVQGPRYSIGEVVPERFAHWGEAQCILPDPITEWLKHQNEEPSEGHPTRNSNSPSRS